MTVGELQKIIETLEPSTHIVVNDETSGRMRLFEVSDATVAAGTPRRDERTGEAGFAFDDKGPARWLFITVEEA